MRVRVTLFILATSCAPIELLQSPVGAGCEEDFNCGIEALCVGSVCHSCPSLDDCVEPEPIGKWTRLERNGCPVCEYAPAAECYGPSDCDQVCYRGARCASVCTRYECCANVCDVAGCDALAPLGCKAACPPEMPQCTTCVAASCRCTPGGWECDVGCADLSPACTYTPP